jgi:hypothetical protein
MQEDLRKKDSLIQELYKQFRSPDTSNVAQELADAKRQIEELRASTSELKRGQEDILAMGTPERGGPGGSVVTPHRVRDKVGKWQEFLETPISVSHRRSRRETPRTRYLNKEIMTNFRVVDEEEVLPVKFTPKSVADKSGVNDDVARLREALAKAESQISQLKLEKAAGKGPGESHELHAHPLGPNMMPGMHH